MNVVGSVAFGVVSVAGVRINALRYDIRTREYDSSVVRVALKLNFAFSTLFSAYMLLELAFLNLSETTFRGENKRAKFPRYAAYTSRSIQKSWKSFVI